MVSKKNSFFSFLSQSAIAQSSEHRLDHESLDLVLQAADLAHEVRGLVGGDAGSDDSAGNTAGL